MLEVRGRYCVFNTRSENTLIAVLFDWITGSIVRVKHDVAVEAVSPCGDGLVVRQGDNLAVGWTCEADAP